MKIQHKRSAALDGGKAKEPTALQTDLGELCVNFNAADPALFIRDNADNIVRVGGDLSLYQKISETAPPTFVCSPDNIDSQSPPSGRDEGTLWWNTEDGTLYIWYEDANSKQWVIAVPQSIPDALTVEEANGLYLSKTTDDTAAGAITFEKETTHEADVKVTGGDLRVVGAGNLGVNSTAASAIAASLQNDNTNSIIRAYQAGSQGAVTASEIYGFSVVGSFNNAIATTMKAAFTCGVDADGDINYQVYAAGDAPSFFAGSTYIGGSTTRNTRELWESTLTEEQKEQLTAGTFAIPANVSVPGDGSFARQWWYDQQSAEDQALIDSGELEYPERFQAANFVDTFDLGDNTNVILSASGISSFKGGAKVSGNFFVSTVSNAEFRGSLTDSNNAALKVSPYNAANTTDVCGIQVGQGSSQGYSRSGVYAGIRLLDFKTNTAGNTYIGIESNLTTSSTGTNYNFYAAGTAPNYFAGVIRTGNVTNPGGTGGDSNPETNDSNRFWATQSTSSNGVRIGGTALQSSYYATSEFGSNIFCNRLGSTLGSFIEFLENGVSVDAISLDGSGGISYGVSDYRLKENIVDLPSATDAVKSLHPVNYNFITHPGKTRPGFIAHELAGVLPVAVTGEKDATVAIGTLADYDGTVLETEVTEPDELEYTEEVETDGVTTQTVRTRTWTPSGTRPVYQGVDQTKLIPLLTKALQEALDRIEQLESNTLQPLYSTLADLPSASDHHGKVAHVHSEGALYFAHAGNWVKLQNA